MVWVSPGKVQVHHRRVQAQVHHRRVQAQVHHGGVKARSGFISTDNRRVGRVALLIAAVTSRGRKCNKGVLEVASMKGLRRGRALVLDTGRSAQLYRLKEREFAKHLLVQHLLAALTRAGVGLESWSASLYVTVYTLYVTRVWQLQPANGAGVPSGTVYCQTSHSPKCYEP